MGHHFARHVVVNLSMIEIVSQKFPLTKGKLSKPKELKGIKQVFSYKYLGKRKIPVFVLGQDIWIYHRDWCSVRGTKEEIEHYEKTHSRKFVYDDNFSAKIIHPGYAWIRINGALNSKIKTTEILRQIVQECYIDKSPFDYEDARMFNDVVVKCREGLNRDDSCYLRDLEECINDN